MENSRIRKVEVIKVIAIEDVVGDGTDENPLQIVVHYYDVDGNYLFTK